MGSNYFITAFYPTFIYQFKPNYYLSNINNESIFTAPQALLNHKVDKGGQFKIENNFPPSLLYQFNKKDLDVQRVC